MRARREKYENWAAARFGRLGVADRRLAARATAVAAGIARRPRGTVTAVFETASEREGAYRLLENDALTTAHLESALGAATARACGTAEMVCIVVDGSSLNLVDTQRDKGFGVVGSYRIGARGVIVQTALAVSGEGTPIDVIGQRYWTRERGKSAVSEMSHVTGLVRDVLARMGEHATSTVPWFQFDRGYDCQVLLSLLRDEKAHFTIRSSADRRLEDSASGKRRYLGDELRRAPALGKYGVELPGGSDKAPRTAAVTVRAAKVTLLVSRKSKSVERVGVWAIEARELGKRDGLLWRLLTSEPADTFEQAMRVIRAYESRWRIEEFHRAWKDGVCHVEETQLRSLSAVTKWATFHATVAARATRLARLARETPDVPADTEFSRPELMAMVALAKKKRLKASDRAPTLAAAVGMVAQLGGYTGKSSGGPPGATVIARGLQRVVDVASVTGLFDDRCD